MPVQLPLFSPQTLRSDMMCLISFAAPLGSEEAGRGKSCVQTSKAGGQVEGGTSVPLPCNAEGGGPEAAAGLNRKRAGQEVGFCHQLLVLVLQAV